MSDLPTLFFIYLKLAFLAIGGAAGILPELYRELVLTHRWMSDAEFAQAYAIGQLAPGPNMLMLIYVGYRLAGLAGVGAAFVGFFAVTSTICAVFSGWWTRYADTPWARAAQRGLAPVAVGLLFSGVWTVASAALTDGTTFLLALLATLLMLSGRLNPVLVIALSGAAGLLFFR
ncbi:MAG: chromate transporter [Chloroflexi bacterium]|nr:chromate transporter [Chloroflexota bacterium]